MPEPKYRRRPERPTEGFRAAHLATHPGRPVGLYLPSDYQPKYAYPLVVLFHAAGADEEAATRLVPNLSRRNYVAVCPRGPVARGAGIDGRLRFAWGDADPLADGYLLAAVARARAEYHIHSERVYLIGIGEGAAAAYRVASMLPADTAGVVALNGEIPCLPRGKPMRGLRAFVGHGTGNPVVPVAAARKAARRLSAAGAAVRFESYRATHRVHPDMLRDVNRWIMGTVTPDADAPHFANNG